MIFLVKHINKICPICSKEFSVPLCHQHRYKTCGYTCGGIYRKKPIITNICQKCKIEFISKKSPTKKQDFCSKKCSAQSRINGEIFICHYCQQEFRIPKNLVERREKNERKYCCRRCVVQDWNENSVKRQRPGSYRQNAWKVYEKKCYDCDLRDSRLLVIHHIDGNRKNGNINNLVPLCHNCHCIRHVLMSGKRAIPSYRGRD